jgi:hypothetical protein
LGKNTILKRWIFTLFLQPPSNSPKRGKIRIEEIAKKQEFEYNAE